MRGWQFTCYNHCFRYYICWSQVSRKLPDNYAVKQLLQQLVEGVHRLACGHSTDKYYSVDKVPWHGYQLAQTVHKYYSVDRVPWQGHQLAYRQCANTIQLIKYPDRIVSWHIDSVQSNLSLTILPALYSHLLSRAIIPACCQSALENYLYYTHSLSHSTESDYFENCHRFSGEKRGHNWLPEETACCIAWSSLTWHHIVWHVIYKNYPCRP